MLQVDQLVKQYKNFRAVDGISFTINPGEIVGLLGPNGAGKTTALRCIAGILRPTEGRILVNGQDIVADQAKAKAGLAFVPEVPSLYELLTVEATGDYATAKRMLDDLAVLRPPVNTVAGTMTARCG